MPVLTEFVRYVDDGIGASKTTISQNEQAQRYPNASARLWLRNVIFL